VHTKIKRKMKVFEAFEPRNGLMECACGVLKDGFSREEA